MATGGFGRGGRGAMLLQALSHPARKPGEEQEEGAAKGSPPVPIGRGAFLAGVLKSAAATTASAAPPAVGQPITTMPPLSRGRGLASLQASLQAAGTSLPKAARGSILVSQMPTSQSPPGTTAGKPPSPVQPGGSRDAVRPQDPPPHGGEGPRPPSSRLERMTIQERRPDVHKQGSDGERIMLSANSIRLKCKNEGVFQYHVDFHPQIDSRNMRIKMVNEHRDVIGYTKAFDGAILYLPIRLPQQETVLTSIRPTDETKVSVIIRLVKVLPPQSCTQLYNIIFRRIMSILEMVQVGRYFYNPATPSSVPQHKLEVWPGYITSVAEQEGGLLLLADASHRVLRTETVYEVMQNIVHRNPQNFRDEVMRTIVGTVVLTRYNNKTYRVDEIVWDKSPRHTFTSSATGEGITFLDYYKKAYNKIIQDEEQPLLLHRPKRRLGPGGEETKNEFICLIPELSYMTGLTDALRADFKVMKDLSCHTRVTPEQRRLTMIKFIRSVNNNEDARKQLENWGLELENDVIEFEGRRFAPEKIVFGNRKQIIAGPEADWGREVTRQNVILAVPLRTWLVLYTKRDQTKANDYVMNMMKVCPQMGIDVAPPTQFELKDDRTETFVRALRDNINPRIQMVVIVCPTSRDDRYSAIKKLTCVECPVPSQVIIGKTISRPDKLRSVTQKIALQINCKLGGELWALPIPMKHVMICGIDVYHDAAKKKGSIAGFVSSTNNTCTRWFSRCAIQAVQQELVDGLKLCLTSAITKYHEINHILPEKIFVFRDGVGDGQLNTVADYEVEQLKQCFKHFGEDYSPNLAVIIVQKRINAKIFHRTPREMQNPPPGTVADHTITRRDWYDFFLVSQHVRQGTVSPTHYIVVHDSTKLKPDNMQKLAYKMTHLYYNWPGTVRVPAPCQYAHKLAYLVGQNIHKEPSKELADRLFFL